MADSRISNFDMATRAWFFPVVAFICAFSCLIVLWAVMEPAALVAMFDSDGRSPFELATLPFFAAIIPLVWWKCPFEGTPLRRCILSTMVTVVVIMAIVKQLDFHNYLLSIAYPDCVGEDGTLISGKFIRPNGKPLGGTPFKMRVITNGAIPLGMKALIVGYFTLFFGFFFAGLAYLFPAFIKGVFRLEPAAWSIGCFGAAGVIVQVADRLPAWFKRAGFNFFYSQDGDVSSSKALCTVLEEGGEMLIALFALAAIFFAHRALEREG